jgi:hypothetical protein
MAREAAFGRPSANLLAAILFGTAHALKSRLSAAGAMRQEADPRAAGSRQRRKHGERERERTFVLASGKRVPRTARTCANFDDRCLIGPG